MKFKQKILSLASQYQNAKLHSPYIQLGYFIISYLCRIPILSVLGAVQCKMFKKFQFEFLMLKTDAQQIHSKPQISFILIISYSLSLILLVVTMARKKNKQQMSWVFYAFIMFEAVSSLGSFYLIKVCLQSQVLIFQLLSACLIAMIQFPIIIIQKILISYEGDKSNAFSHKLSNKIFMLDIVERLIFYIVLVLGFMNKNQAILRNLFYSTLTIIYTIRIYLNVIQKYYIDNLSHLLETSGTFICLILLILINMYEILEEPLLLSNFPAICLLMAIFAFLSVYSYKKYMENQYLFMPLDQITSRQLMIPYLTALYRLWRQQGSSLDSYLIASFRKNHEIQCKDIKCDCRKQKQLNQMDANLLFLQNYLKKTFKNLLTYTKNTQVVLQILFYRLQMFHEIYSVNQKLKELKQQINKSNISTEAGIYILHNKLQLMIKKRNSSSVSIDVMAILNLQEKINQMQKIILNDIKIKNHKWKYLCQGLCKSSDIEEDIVQEISNLIAFGNIYHGSKLNYKKNLAFNALSLFYYGSIVFLKKEIEPIQKNLRQLFVPTRLNFVSNEKQLEQNIFNHRCCLIEFDIHLQDELSLEFQLFVRNCNKNIINVFKCNKPQLIGTKMEKLFPSFLWNDMKAILRNHFESNSFSKNVQNYYYLDSEGRVFEGLTCIKIVARHDLIECVFFVLKKQVDNVVLVNEQGLIENVGSTYIQNFTSLYNQLPFSCLFLSPQEFEEKHLLQLEEKKKVHMIDAHQMKQGWQNYLSNAINYVKKEHAKSTPEIDTSKKNIGYNNRSYFRKYYDFLRNERKQLVNAKKRAISLVSIIVNKEYKLPKGNISLLNVLMRSKRCELNGLIFYKIVLDKIEKKALYQYGYLLSSRRRLSMQQQNNNYLTKDDPYNVEERNAYAKKRKEEYSSFENIEQNDSESNSIISLKDPINQDQEFIMQTNSINSSLTTVDLMQFNNRFIEICFKLFKNPEQIDDKRLKFFTANSFIFSIIFVGLLVGSFTMFKLNLQEVKDIFFADGAVSDNMQLAEFMYNRALNFKLYRQNSTYVEMIRKSAQFEREYLYGLMTSDQHNFIQVITSLTNTRFYQYIIVPVLWKNSSKETDSVEIDSNQFLLFYKLLSMDVDSSVQDKSSEALINTEKSLVLMKINFPQLKRINHWNLFLYKQLSDNSLDLIERLFVFLSIGHVGISIVIFFIFYRQKLFRRVQQIDGYSIYKIIPSKVIDILSNYYTKLFLQNQSETDLMKYENYFETYGLVLNADNKAFNRQNRSVFVTNNSKSPLAAFKMLFALLFMNVFFCIFIVTVSRLVQPIKAMMNNVNNLMDSENYLLQSYFDLKANFIVDGEMNLTSSYFDDLLSSQQESEVIFNKISVQSLTLFTSYDPNFSSDFIHLLISDACDLAQTQIPKAEYDKCKTFFKLKFLQNGVSMGMNYFTRKVRQTINEIKIHVSKSLQSGIHPQQIKLEMMQKFREDSQFKQIDESIFYMFKLFQGTQAKIYDSLETTIISTMDMCFLLVLAQILVIGILYPLSLFLNYKHEKFELSKLYVSFLLIPTPVSQLIKSFSEKIEQILQYN